jgi:hypothetical protein
MRTTFKKANEEFKERQLRLTEERRSLHELDTLIHELKGIVFSKLYSYAPSYDNFYFC